MLPMLRTPARLAAHDGELVERGDGPTLWLGDMTPTLLAALMRSGSDGAVQVRPDGRDAREVWIQRCWYDVTEGKMAVQLRERSAPS